MVAAVANSMCRKGCDLPTILPEFHGASNRKATRSLNSLVVIMTVKFMEPVDVALTIDQVSPI